MAYQALLKALDNASIADPTVLVPLQLAILSLFRINKNAHTWTSHHA